MQQILELIDDIGKRAKVTSQTDTVAEPQQKPQQKPQQESEPEGDESSASHAASSTDASASAVDGTEGGADSVASGSDAGKGALGQRLLKDLVRVVRLLPSTQVRAFVLAAVMRRENMRLTNRDHVRTYFRHLAQALSSTQREDLFNLLTFLPPGVMGDMEEKERIRVFVDVKADARASYALERKRLSKRYTKPTIELMENASHELLLLLAKDELITAVQGDYEPSSIESASSSSTADDPSSSSAMSKNNPVHTKWRLIATLLSQLPPPDRARLLLQQILLSHIMPSDRVARGKIMATVMNVTAKELSVPAERSTKQEDETSAASAASASSSTD